MKTSRLARSLIAVSAFLSAAALAQAGITPGMQIVDASGGAVGTVTKVSGDTLTVKTDRHEVQLPASSFTPNAGKLLFGMTRDQLNAATDEALAAASAAIAVGAQVRDSAGELAGTIEKVEDAITIKLVSGELVRLPKSAVSGSANGVVVAVTLAELKAAAQAAQPAEAAPAADTPQASSEQ
jgi:preprotein translocase subunit YajC